MYSKYILNSNWTSLSSNYKYDEDIEFISQQFPIAGNLPLTYTNYLSGLKDYSNNNFSLFFLTDNKNINYYINKKVPESNVNKTVHLVAYNLENNLISESTRFLNIKNNVFGFNDILLLSEDNFFEIEFIDQYYCLFRKTVDGVDFYLCIDDINTVATTLTANKDTKLDSYLEQQFKLNYVLDNSRLIVYKNIQNITYFLGIDEQFDSVRLFQGNFDDIPGSCLLYYVKIGDLPNMDYNNIVVKYKNDVFKNNLNIDTLKSIKDSNNNLLFHTEYNNILNDYSSNYLTLKNQLDIFQEANNNNNNNNFKKYTSVFTGGNREDGSNLISLNYKTSYFPIEFKTDKVTWFHIPYNTNRGKLLINSSNFVINGAVGGSSPIYSDKIWKKVGNYSNSSNLGNTTDREHSGQWLCSWLSAGSNGDYIWMDRFYNPSTFTPYQALKYNTNANYTPEYEKNKRGEGITDIISTLSLEPGVWYAYSHIGKNTAKNLLAGIDFLYKEKFDSYKNRFEKKLTPILDSDNEPIYVFDGNSYSSVDTPKPNTYNNFSLSFFCTRDNWNTTNINNVFSNYLDYGFGITNNNNFNPLIFYINGKKLDVFNNEYRKILTIDTEFLLSSYGEENYLISGIFRRDYNNNFHVITSHFKLLEFNANGTLVDLKDFTDKISNLTNPAETSIESYNNNSKTGLIRFSNNTFLTLDLLTNDFTVPNSDNINYIDTFSGSSSKLSVAIDSLNNIYAMEGFNPIVKGTDIYYKSKDCKSIERYSPTTGTLNTYLSSTSGMTIMDFNFDNLAKTYILYTNYLEEYNELGEYLKTISFKNIKNDLSACNITFQELLKTDLQPTVHFIDSLNKNYLLNTNNDNLVKVDDVVNDKFSTFSKIEENNFDLSNYNYIQGVINNAFPLPSYNLKFKLFNQLDYEDSSVLSVTVLGETLDVGTHHFCVVFNSLDGYFEVYIDGILYSKKIFAPKRYSFSNLLTDNFIIGTPPFFNGVTFNEFYKSNSVNLFANDLRIEKFRLYSDVLNFEEVKLLYFEKFPPLDITVNIEIGERNYLDTITRVFKHKMQGSKSNLINLYVNNSLITDESIQEMYNSILIKELTPYLPGYVKINKIIWLNTIESDDKLIVGDFSIKNSLTDTEGGVEI